MGAMAPLVSRKCFKSVMYIDDQTFTKILFVLQCSCASRKRLRSARPQRAVPMQGISTGLHQRSCLTQNPLAIAALRPKSISDFSVKFQRVRMIASVVPATALDGARTSMTLSNPLALSVDDHQREASSRRRLISSSRMRLDSTSRSTPMTAIQAS